MPYYAHSGRTAREGRSAVPPQEYGVHVGGVMHAALRHAREMACFLEDEGQSAALVATVFRAALAHDMGKLLPENAALLGQTFGEERPPRLPINHVDAGVAHLLNEDQMAALLAWAHHCGLDQEFRRFLVKCADYSQQYNILALDFL